MIHAALDRDETVVGGVVGVSGSWQAEKEVRAIKISLRWQTEGRGSTDSKDVDSTVIDGSLGPLPPTFAAQLRVPPAGPVTYDGSLIRVRWFVRVSLDVAWQGDPKEDLPLRVLPVVLDGAG